MHIKLIMPLVSLLAGLWPAFALSAKLPITIDISAPKSTFAIGSEIKVNVNVKNISTHQIHLPLDKSGKAELNGYLCAVSRSDGKPVLITSYYWALNGEIVHKEGVKDPDKVLVIVGDLGGSVGLDPGRTLLYQMDVDELYDFSNLEHIQSRSRSFTRPARRS